MKKSRIFLMLAGIAALTLPSKNFAKDFPASYVPHIQINKYTPQRDGTVIVDMSWDNIPDNIKDSGIITVAGKNIVDVEGGIDGVDRVHNTVDNIHFIIKKQDNTVMKLIYGQRDKDKGYTIIEYWPFRIADKNGK